MIKETISKVIKRILNNNLNFTVERFPFEDSKGFYKSIYKIITNDNVYVLKKAKSYELEAYRFLQNIVDSIPYYYGTTKYYGNDYILIEYVTGQNAMRMDKSMLVKIINQIIKVQKATWQSNNSFGVSLETSIKRKYNRLKYLPDELQETYEKFISCYKKTPVAFSHEDLLPFNVLVNDNRVCFIDLEECGLLPYPTMLARLIAFTEEKGDALFYLSKEDYQYGIRYYYDAFIKECEISEKQYFYTINLFIFNELIEWVFVYNKEKYQHNSFYKKWYEKALQLGKQIK